MMRSSHESQRLRENEMAGGSSSSSSSSSSAQPDGTAAGGGAGGAGRPPLDTQEDTYGFIPRIQENEETMALHLHAQQANKQLGPREDVGPRFGT